MKMHTNKVDYSTFDIRHSALNRGFTLMELLIVIAMLAILATAGVGSYIQSLKRGRDASRKSDIRQIQKALELYIQDQKPPEYPVDFSSINCNKVWNPYMSIFPCNNFTSTSNKVYIYTRGVDKITYTLVACLENENDTSKDSLTDINCTNASYTVTQP